MQVPLEITFRDIHKTEAIELLINKHVQKLERICDTISSCRVVIERPQRHQHSGTSFHVRIDMTVPPGHEIVASKEPGDAEMHMKLPTIIKDAFDAAERQLKDVMARQRNEVKIHPEQMTNGIVSKLFPKEGYGFIQSLDNVEIYFNKNSVLNNEFDRLEPGTGVHFTKEQGESGPQASSVQISDKPGVRMPKV